MVTILFARIPSIRLLLTRFAVYRVPTLFAFSVVFEFGLRIRNRSLLAVKEHPFFSRFLKKLDYCRVLNNNRRYRDPYERSLRL